MAIAFLFSGQGAQYSGMMKDIVEKNEKAKEVYTIADESLEYSISDLCFKGTQEELNLTHNTQPCVLAADLAAYAIMIDYNIKPDAVAGFSLGEYAALVAAGVIDIRDVFPVIQKRADYMQDAVPVGKGAMAAVMKLSSKEVLNLCSEVDGYVAPANYNCPGQIVISGEIEAIDKLLLIAKERKIRAVKLSVSAPFHCDMMNPAAENLKVSLSMIPLSKPVLPIYMNVDAEIENDPERILKKLILQAKSPVYWEKTLRNMYDAGIDTFIELGPGKTLSGFVKKTFSNGENVSIYNVTDLTSLEITVSALKER